MKKFYLLTFLVITLFAGSKTFAQETDCDDPNKPFCCQAGNAAVIAITPLSELKCKNKQSSLYGIFPQIPIYKGYLFNQINLCSETGPGGVLEFDYCIAKTRQHLRITISDLKSPWFDTEVGRAQKGVYLALFSEGLVNPMFNNYPSKNKVFTKSYINMANATKRVDYVTFEALHQNRYYVHIVADGNRFTQPTVFDEFMAAYIKEFKL